jgi:hypothetical protein
MAAIVNLKQGSLKWLEHRTRIPQCLETPAVLSVSLAHALCALVAADRPCSASADFGNGSGHGTRAGRQSRLRAHYRAVMEPWLWSTVSTAAVSTARLWRAI